MFKILFTLLVSFVSLDLQAQDAALEIQRAKLADMYSTVAAIESGEEIFFAENGSYAAQDKGLCFTDVPQCRENFSKILDVNIASNSLFAYDVSGSPARLSVKVIETPQSGVLCYRFLDGNKKGKWFVDAGHPWSAALTASASGVELYEL